MPIVFASTYDEATNASTFTRDRSAEKTFVTDDQLDETNEQLEDLERKFEEAGPGEPGENGITPHIGLNGNWFIGETDTGMPSRGEQGKDGIGVERISIKEI